VFHAPQPSHRPCHRGCAVPQDWQMNDVDARAMMGPVVAPAPRACYTPGMEDKPPKTPQEFLAILKRGREAWNQWREDRPHLYSNQRLMEVG
jgi:hypothetical protein